MGWYIAQKRILAPWIVRCYNKSTERKDLSCEIMHNKKSGFVKPYDLMVQICNSPSILLRSTPISARINFVSMFL